MTTTQDRAGLLQDEKDSNVKPNDAKSVDAGSNDGNTNILKTDESCTYGTKNEDESKAEAERDLDVSDKTNTKQGIATVKSESSGSGEWNSVNTRVFDVYISDGSQNQKKLPDIFDYKTQPTNKNWRDEKFLNEEGAYKSGNRYSPPLPSSHILINTGQGRKVSLPIATPNMVYKKPSSMSHRAQSLSLSLEQRLSTNINQISLINRNNSSQSNAPGMDMNAMPTPISAMSMNSGTIIPPESLVNNDKWPPHVESAFINALQLVMKNGTAKIKLKDKNYGRNELISLYIKNKTGEQRSKKQISSHIQVWKKSIANKVQNDIQTSRFESELLQLIENGAEQTAENWKTFESTFKSILEKEDNETEFNHGIRTSHTNPIPTQLSHEILCHTHLPIQQQYSTMPMQHAVYAQPNSAVPILSYHIPMMKEPATPLEFAQELYGSLKSFKCVPVNPYEQYNPYSYSHTIQHHNIPNAVRTPVSSGAAPTTSRGASQLQPNGMPLLKTPMTSTPHAQSIFQVAKEVENQQKKLIDELYQKQNHNQYQNQHQEQHQHQQLNQAHHQNQSYIPHLMIQQHQPYDSFRRTRTLPPASQLSSNQPTVLTQETVSHSQQS